MLVTVTLLLMAVEPAPTSRDYCGHSEARNLFIQILNKNFIYTTREDAQVLKTDIREVTGSKPTFSLSQKYYSY